MRVGLIAPPFVPVPPGAYGGTEAVVANLAVELQRLGHEVRLFTVGDSTCPVDRAHLFEHAVVPIGAGVEEAAHVLAAYRELDDVDIIHDHTILGPLISGRAGITQRPVVVTNHGPFTPITRPLFAEATHHASLVAISHDHAARAGDVPVSAVVHHGVDVEVYRPTAERGEHLVFIGRMSPDKGVHTAVQVARLAGRRLHIIAKMRERGEREYYQSMVRPLLGPDDPEPVELPLAERVSLLRTAYGLLNPIAWPEPFGLVMAESLASGTPVVATPLGAAPEIITPGRTGFLPTSVEEAVEAVQRLEEIDRSTCRLEALRRFSAARMAADYVSVYERVLQGRALAYDDRVVRPDFVHHPRPRQRLERRTAPPEASTSMSYRPPR